MTERSVSSGLLRLLQHRVITQITSERNQLQVLSDPVRYFLLSIADQPTIFQTLPRITVRPAFPPGVGASYKGKRVTPCADSHFEFLFRYARAEESA